MTTPKSDRGILGSTSALASAIGWSPDGIRSGTGSARLPTRRSRLPCMTMGCCRSVLILLALDSTGCIEVATTSATRTAGSRHSNWLKCECSNFIQAPPSGCQQWRAANRKPSAVERSASQSSQSTRYPFPDYLTIARQEQAKLISWCNDKGAERILTHVVQYLWEHMFLKTSTLYLDNKIRYRQACTPCRNHSSSNKIGKSDISAVVTTWLEFEMGKGLLSSQKFRVAWHTPTLFFQNTIHNTWRTFYEHAISHNWRRIPFPVSEGTLRVFTSPRLQSPGQGPCASPHSSSAGRPQR